MPRKLSKHAPVKVAAKLKRRQAAELRAQKLTLQEIAEQLGVTKPRVSQMLDEWDAEFKQENVEVAARITRDQLEEVRLIKAVWLPLVLDEEKTSPKHLAAYCRLMAQEADVGGVKKVSAVKTEISGPGGGPVQTESTTTATVNWAGYSTEDLLALEKAAALLAASKSS